MYNNKLKINNNFISSFNIQLIKFLNKNIKYVLLKTEKTGTQYHLKNSTRYLIFILNFFKKSSFIRADLFTDIIAKEYNKNNSNFFSLEYIFYSSLYNNSYHIVLKSKILTIPSITNIFLGALWIEREIYDMFGLFFLNNNDLRRILTDYGFSGHPLKKEFPLTGIYEIFYSDNFKQIKTFNLENIQIFNKKYIY